MSLPEVLEGAWREGQVFAPRSVGVLEIQGEEAPGFLQRMLTQDVTCLRPGRGARACLTDRMAKIVGAMELLRSSQGFLAVTDPDSCQALAKALQMYVFASKVSIQDRSSEYACLELRGPGLEDCLVRMECPLPDQENLAHLSGEWQGVPVQLIRSSRLGGAGMAVLLPVAQEQGVIRLLQSARILRLPEPIARGFRVEAGTAVFGVDYDGGSMPTEVGLEDSISYKKGCYVGQEILERLRSRGKVTRVLCCLQVTGSLDENVELSITHGQTSLGLLTSLAPSPCGAYMVGLASLPAREIQSGETLRVAGLDARIKEFV